MGIYAMKQLFTISALTLILASAAGAEKLTYSDLVMRLVDMEQLAVLPLRGETCQQASSYDRASKYDATTGKYVNWDANGDNAGVVREEDVKLVLAEIRGPGCITRMWSALADQGHVRIYLDGAKNPAVDLPFVSYFDGKTEPFNYPSLVHTVARGLNNYVPIPFQKSCKIVADKGWGAYYQFTYRTFPVGTIIPTFFMKLSANDKELLAKVNTFLTSGGGTDPSQMTSVLSKRWTNNYALGTAGSVTDTILGPRAIVAIKVELPELSAERYETLLREAVIQINWDGETYPSVLVPLGDFFGTAPGLNSYTSLPMSVKGQTLTSYWYMPFGKSATINLKCGAQAFGGQVKLEIDSQMLDKPIETYGRFHAKWHRDAFLPQSPERSIDWTMLTTQGRGRFVGTALEIWNPRGAWWGEGDEKFFVDGEKFPSTFGTGSEDYFGYAWCDPTLFQNAYHNQTRNDGGNRGHVAVNRWHIADSIPFQTSFEGYIEKYFSNNRPTLYANTVYWYLEPGG
ncbi:MAG: glycoside hydrolase family 172 protein, partial [Armatimonadota bacterium]